VRARDEFGSPDRGRRQAEVLAFHHRGRYLNSPNDVTTRAADGAIYFTDPGIGGGDGRKGAPDGMKCDPYGNAWCTGPGGIWILSPEGDHLGTLATPEFMTNLAWGGPEWCSLFMTGTTSLYVVRSRVASAQLPYF